MTAPEVADAARLDAVRAAAVQADGLELLLLHGSRSRGAAHPGSDWDLGYLGDIDPADLLDAVASALGTDDVDLVDLARAGALLRFEAGRDGVRLYGTDEVHLRDARSQGRVRCPRMTSWASFALSSPRNSIS